MATNAQKITKDDAKAPSMVDRLEALLVRYLDNAGLKLADMLAEAFPEPTDKGRVDVMLGKIGWVDGGFDKRVKKAAVTRVRRVLVVGGKNWTAIGDRVVEMKKDVHLKTGKGKLVNDIADKVADGLSLAKAEAAVAKNILSDEAMAKARWDAAVAELVAAGNAYVLPEADQKRLDKVQAMSVAEWKLVEVTEDEKDEDDGED